MLNKSEDRPEFGIVFSKWVTLQKDQYYYAEATLEDINGQVSLDVGMEVKPETMPENHPYAEK